MRQITSSVVLIVGSTLFAACAKKPESAPAAPDAAAASAPAPAEDPTISFSLGDGKNSATTPTTQASTTTLRAPSSEPSQVEPARLISRVLPFYPLSLRMQGIEGRVDVRLVISKDGVVEQAEVIGATEPRFSDFALAAIRMSRFSPAKRNGIPEALVTETSVAFASEFGSMQMPSSSPLARLAYQDDTYYAVNAAGKLALADLKEPIAILQLIPPTPASAKAGETLQARIKFTVTEEGQVINPTVSGATNADLSRAILEVVPFWQYIPRMKAGKPTVTNVELPFKLETAAKAD